MKQSAVKEAAIGVRMHSGWGALVAVSHRMGKVEVIERRRLAITAATTAGASQPYHFAKNLELPEAERFVGRCLAESQCLALAALRELVAGLDGRQFRVAGCAILLASGRPLPDFSKILASHALIHAAEGEFFREAFWQACAEAEIPVAGFREGGLEQCCQDAFGPAATSITRQLSSAGRSLGPPWTRDQKTAALAALLVLEKCQA